MKTFIVQIARGAQADTADARWLDCDFRSSLEQAREAMADKFADKAMNEDRGDEFRSEWDRLADQAKTIEVGEVLAFDEYAVRIRVDED